METHTSNITTVRAALYLRIKTARQVGRARHFHPLTRRDRATPIATHAAGNR